MKKEKPHAEEPTRLQAVKAMYCLYIATDADVALSVQTAVETEFKRLEAEIEYLKKVRGMQPIHTDKHGTVRFKPNPLVRYLLDAGGINLNDIAIYAAETNVSEEHQMQLAQLIGYSVSGYGGLSYVTEESNDLAWVEAERVASQREKK
jgi:hypothetical protein